MKILSLELYRYKRFMLNNIDKITFTPDSMYQLILGTNGSGKSSLLNELSPLPPNPATFKKGGYKKIKIEDKGVIYQLTSTFNPTGKHTFMRGDEVVISDANGTVMKELVEQEFGITQDVHDLLVGNINYTTMTPAKRREWITRLSDVDFTYALDVYQKFRSAARDAQGALKHANSRITAERNKLLAIGDLEELEKTYQDLHNLLNVLFTEKDNMAKPTHQLERRVDEVLRSIEELSKILVSKKPDSFEGYKFDTLIDVDEALSKLNVEREVKISLRDRIAKEAGDLSQLIGEFGQINLEDLDKLRAELNGLLEEEKNILNSVKIWKDFKAEPVEALATLDDQIHSLTSGLKQLPPNINRRFNRNALTEAKSKLEDVNSKIERVRNNKASLEVKLERLTSLKEQECPKCNHVWVPGRSERDKIEIEKGIKGFSEELENLAVKRKEYAEYVEEADNYSQAFYTLRQLSYSNPCLGEFWEYMFNSDALLEDPESLIGDVYALHKDLEQLVKLHSAKERIEHLEKLFRANSDNDQIKSIKDRMDGLNVQLEEVTKELDEVQRVDSKLSKYKKHIEVYLTKSEELERKIEELHTLRDELTLSIRNRELDALINSSQTQLAGIQQRRTEKITLEGIIKDLEEDQEDLGLDLESLNSLASALSPIDGLIAEQLTGFIESFVSHVNQVIESIWSYELKVMPCAKESGDLDYKFPIHIRHEGEQDTSPDISKGSEAQMDVIDFAFRLVSMIYLGLEEYPIYLDEFSSSFDEQHRINAMTFIKRLIDTGNYTQMFLVSHYASQFGIFNQAEILVLDSTNISVPQQHNQHVVIE